MLTNIKMVLLIIKKMDLNVLALLTIFWRNKSNSSYKVIDQLNFLKIKQ